MEDFSALPLVVLAEKFAALPGIGMKTAQRLAYAVMEMPEDEAAARATAVAFTEKLKAKGAKYWKKASKDAD